MIAKSGPMISVIVPTYNEGSYINHLLKSIKNQTYKNYEIIITDYKSTDDTLKIAKRYGARIVRAKSRGIPLAKNLAMKKVKGDIIGFVDADHILSKNVFESVVKAFKNEDNLAGAEPSLRVDTREMPVAYRPLFRLFTRVANVIKKISFMGPFPWAFSCVFCSASAVKKAGEFNLELDLNDDLEYFARIRKFGTFKLLSSTARRSFRRELKKGIIRAYAMYFYGALVATFTQKYKHDLEPIRVDSGKN